MKYEAIKRYSSKYSVRKMCMVLELRQSEYYQWLSRQGNYIRVTSTICKEMSWGLLTRTDNAMWKDKLVSYDGKDIDYPKATITHRCTKEIPRQYGKRCYAAGSKPRIRSRAYGSSTKMNRSEEHTSEL